MIYDESGNILNVLEIDCEKGWLETVEETIHHDATPAQEEISEIVILEGTENMVEGGLKHLKVIKPAVPAQDAWDEIIYNQIYHPYTEEELAERSKPAFAECMEAQVLYTAMMTDTLLAEVMADA